MCRSSCFQNHLCLPFACFFPCSWKAYKREKCQTSRLKPYRKYWKYRKAFFLVGCWLLAAGWSWRWLLTFVFPCAWNAYKREPCQTSRLKPVVLLLLLQLDLLLPLLLPLPLLLESRCSYCYLATKISLSAAGCCCCHLFKSCWSFVPPL